MGTEDGLAGAVPDAEHGEGGEVVGVAFADEQSSVGCGAEGVEVVMQQRRELPSTALIAMPT
ncbi:hypothetical protein [Jiangella muralis]|uniref:hypothetical protein n=1 Tax=Jiangella muralis TaxID=702383 RepID=UPI00069D9DD1|nr:hypothetical protein [Jiangella muralis]